MTVISGAYFLPHHCSLQSLTLHSPAFKRFDSTFTKSLNYTLTPQPFKTFSLSSPLSDLKLDLIDTQPIPVIPSFSPAEFSSTYIYPVAVTLIGIIILALIYRALIVRFYYRAVNRTANPIHLNAQAMPNQIYPALPTQVE